MFGVMPSSGTSVFFLDLRYSSDIFLLLFKQPQRKTSVVAPVSKVVRLGHVSKQNH